MGWRDRRGCTEEEPWMCDEVLGEIRGLSNSCSHELVRACGLGHLEVVVSLVESGVSVNNSDLPPLHAACASGHLEIAKFLIAKGADVSKVWKESTALHAALSRGHRAIVHALVDQNARLVSALSREIDRDGSILHLVHSTGFVEPCFLKKRFAVDPNDPCSRRQTPLEVCVERGDADTMCYLLDRGATDLTLGRRRLAPLACVTRTTTDNGVACLRALVERDPASVDLHLCLRLALSVKNYDCARFLVDDLKLVCKPSQLVALCSTGDAILAKKFLRNGADPNSGQPLVAACVQGHHECVKVLLDYGADPTLLTFHLQRCCAIALSKLDRPAEKKSVVVADDDDDFRQLCSSHSSSGSMAGLLLAAKKIPLGGAYRTPTAADDSSSLPRPYSPSFPSDRRRRRPSPSRRHFEAEADIRAAIKRHRAWIDDEDCLASRRRRRERRSYLESETGSMGAAPAMSRQLGIGSFFFASGTGSRTRSRSVEV